MVCAFNKKGFNIMIILIFTFIIFPSSDKALDFTYYPEDKAISTDFIYHNGEIFHSAYYFSSSSTKLDDRRNGIAVYPKKECIVSTPLENSNDTGTATSVLAIDANKTNKKAFLLNTMTTDSALPNAGIICNFDLMGNLMSNSNTIKIYLWVINTGSTVSTFTVKGCSTASLCADAVDYDQDIPTGLIYNQYDRKVEYLTIRRSSANSALIGLNTDTPTTEVLYNTVEGKLYLRLAFDASESIKLSYFQVNILNTANSNFLLGSGPCTTGDNCLPGFQCDLLGLCSTFCHPACSKCTNNIEFKKDNDNKQCTSCSMISSKYFSGPNAMNCNPIDHVDITSLQNISGIVPEIRYSNGFTMGFWMFISDQTKIGDQLINVVLENTFLISVGIDTNISTICNIYLANYPFLKTIYSMTTMKSYVGNSNFAILKTSFSDSQSGKWFYSRCGYSTDAQYMYNMLTIQNNANPIKSENTNLQGQAYYKDVQSDFFLRYFYGTSMTFLIANAQSITDTEVYMRNLHIYSNLIPASVSVQYFSWTSSSNINFPELFIMANFDSLDIATSNGQTVTTMNFSYYNLSNNLISNVQMSNLSLSSKTKLFNIPSTFYRMNFLQENSYFANSDLTSTSLTLCPSETNSCLENNSPIHCSSNYFYDTINNICSVSCPNGTMPNYEGDVSIGTSVTGGYCSFHCKPNVNSKAIGIICENSTQLSNFVGNFSCDAGYTKSHLSCYQSVQDKNGALLYSGFFNSVPKIHIPVSPSLQSYYFSIWYNADRVFTPPVTPGAKYYILVTSGIRIYRDSSFSANNDYKLEDSSSGLIGTIVLKYGQWYRLAYSVSFSSPNYQIVFFYNKYTGNITSTPSTTNLTLSYISFCNGDCESNPSTVNWFTGFYRGLRIWDSTYIPLSLFQNMDQYLHFNTSGGAFGNQPLMRFKANVIYYPLHLFGLKDQKIIDPNRIGVIDVTAPVVTPSINNKYAFNQWNYFTTFNSASSGYMITSLSLDTATNLYIPTTSACGGNCSVCNVNECLTCNTGFYLSKGVCSPYTEQYYYLFSPVFIQNTSTPVDLVYKSFTTLDKDYTISFFVKLLGWEFNTAGDTFDIIRYGAYLAVRYNILTMKLELYTPSGVVATYLSFNSLFGTWVHISLGYSYHASKVSLYPPQLNFQVAFTNLDISYSSLSTFNVNNIVIPKESIGIYAKLWLWNAYLVGSFANISYTSRIPSPVQKLFDKVTSSTQCVVTSDLGNANISYNCVMDYDNLLNETKYCSIPSFYKTDGTCGTLQSTCPSGYFINKTIITDCGCSFTDSRMFIIKNTNKNICKTYDYLDFSRYSPITVPNIKTGANGYTLEFWVFIMTYLPGTFPGFQIKWDKQLLIKLSYTAGSFQSTCYPLYDSSNASKEALNSSTVTFTFGSTWAYIRCSVDLLGKSFLHSTEGSAQVNALNGAPPLIPLATTLTFAEVGVDSNYGLIFFRHIRLWNCYSCQDPDTYRTDITSSTVGTYTSMLHLYDPIFTSGMTFITDIKSAVNSSALVANSNWIGNNIINEANYLKLTTPTLCNENSTTCSSLLQINQAKDMTFQGIEPGRYGRYTLEFWTFVSGTLTNGYHLIWRNLASVTLYSGKIYCWPQDFRTDISTVFGTSITSSLTTKMYNYDSGTMLSTWNWVRCAVSYNLKTFYMSSQSVKTLKFDYIYPSSTFDSPLRYFFSSKQLSSFSIAGAALNTSATIYIRNVYLFNDYIPPTYLFGNLDLSSITSSQFPSLVFSVSLAKFNKTFFSLPYTTGDTLQYIPIYPYVTGGTFTYSTPSGYSSLTLCTMGYKYSSSTCSQIVDCNFTTVLNALYCKDEKTPIICKPGFFYNPPDVSSGIGKCGETCNPNSLRSPGSATKSGICNLTCDSSIYSKCTFTNAELLDLNSNLTCITGYDRNGYNCVLDATSQKSSLYFNGCLNYPNIFYTYPDNSIPSGYFIEFWIKIEKNNESLCTVNTAANVKKMYFLAEPHIIYDTSNLLTYELTEWVAPQTATKGNLSSTISLYNWNHIIIAVDSLRTFVKVYSNFNIFAADVTITSILPSYNLRLKGIGFCANPNSTCFDSTKFYSQNFQWGAAFYKNLRIWDYSNISIYGIFDYNMKLFTDNVNGLLFEYPLNIKTSLNNQIKATRGFYSASINANSQALANPSSFLPNNNYGNFVYPAVDDNDLLILSSSYLSFDYTEKNSGMFLKGLDTMTGTPTSVGYCHQLCARCVSQAICFECIPGYKLVGYYCKKFTRYYLKLPIHSSNPIYYLQMNVNDLSKKNFSIKNEKRLTFTLWIKMYGQISQFDTNAGAMIVIPCFPIIRLKTDGTRTICFDQSEKSLKMISDDVTYFQDTTFPSVFGQWCMLSFATLIIDSTMQYNLSPMSMLYIQTAQALLLRPIPFPGFTIEVIDFGTDFSALVSDLRIYKDFILNPYGYISGMNKDKMLSLFFALSVNAMNPNGPLMQDEDLNTEGYPTLKDSETYYTLMEIQGVGDYNIFHSNIMCARSSAIDLTTFTVSSSIQNKVPCVTCSSSCSSTLQACAGKYCTHSMNLNEVFFRYDQATSMLVPESHPYIEFSRFSSANVTGVNFGKDREQTVEFWYYLYPYNSTSIQFDSEEIIWDLNMYVKLYYPKDNSTSIIIQCAPYYDSSNITLSLSYYNEEKYTAGIGTWNYFQCGSTVPLNKTYINQQAESSILIDPTYITAYTKSLTSVLIQPGNGARTNYGFLYIKELKFWNTYWNVRLFNTKCRMTGILTTNYFPELAVYFSNDVATTLKDNVLSVSGNLIQRSDFIGYNPVQNLTLTDITKQWATGVSTAVLPVCISKSSYAMSPISGYVTGLSTSPTHLILAMPQIKGDLYRFYMYFRWHQSDPIYELQSYSAIPEFLWNPALFREYQFYHYSKSKTDYFAEMYCDVKSSLTGEVITLYRSVSLARVWSNALALSTKSPVFSAPIATFSPIYQFLNRAKALFPYTLYKLKAGELPNENYKHSVIPLSNLKGHFLYTQTNFFSSGTVCYGYGLSYSIDSINFCVCYGINYNGEWCSIVNTSTAPYEYSEIVKQYKFLIGLLDYQIFQYDPKNPLYKVTGEMIDTVSWYSKIFTKLVTTYDDGLTYINLLNLLFHKDYLAERDTLNDDERNIVNQVQFSANCTDLISRMFYFTVKKMYTDRYNNFIKYLQQFDTNTALRMINLTRTLSEEQEEKDNRRILQSTNFTYNQTYTNIFNAQQYKNNMTYTPDQVSFYSKALLNLRRNLINFANAKLLANAHVPNFSFKYNSSQYDLYIQQLQYATHIEQSYSNYFNEFFLISRLDYKNFFDARDCLIEFAGDSNNQAAYDLTNIYFVYIAFNFDYHTAYDLASHAKIISLPTYLQFYDGNLKRMNVTCPLSGISHYFALYSNDEDIYDDYNSYPEKYWKLPYPEDLKYTIPFVFQNYTIDTRDYGTQVLMYSPQFHIRGLVYNVTSGTFEENPGIVRYITFYNGFLLANSTGGGEFIIFGDNIPITFQLGNQGTYRQIFSLLDPHFMRLFGNQYNYLTNMCFLAVGCLIFFHFAVFFSLINDEWSRTDYVNLGNLHSFDELINLIITEFNKIEEDNKHFNHNRFIWVFNLQLNIQIYTPIGQQPIRQPEAASFDSKFVLNQSCFNKTQDRSIIQQCELGKVEALEIKPKIGDKQCEAIEVKESSSPKRCQSLANSKGVVDIQKMSSKDIIARKLISSGTVAPFKEDLSPNKKKPVQEDQDKDESKVDLMGEFDKSKKLVLQNEEENSHIKIITEKVNPNQVDIIAKPKIDIPKDSANEMSEEMLKKEQASKIPNDECKKQIASHTLEFDKRKRIYNPFYFIFFRNIYRNLWLNSFFNPKFKTFSKLMLLIWLEMTISIVLIVGSDDIDVTQRPTTDLIKQGTIAGYIMASVFFSNFFNVFFSMFYKIKAKTRDDILKLIYHCIFNENKILSQASQKTISTMVINFRRQNKAKTTIALAISLGLMLILLYVTFMYGNIWPSHQQLIIVVMFVTVIFDFMMMEIFLEIFILFAYPLRNKVPWILSILLSIKNLRNYY